MDQLEHILLSLVPQHKRIFGRIADAYRAGIPVDEKTGREFQQIRDMKALQSAVSEKEFQRALETVCKTLIEHEEVT